MLWVNAFQAYYWPTSSQLVGNHSDVDRIHIGVVA